MPSPLPVTGLKEAAADLGGRAVEKIQGPATTLGRKESIC